MPAALYEARRGIGATARRARRSTASTRPALDGSAEVEGPALDGSALDGDGAALDGSALDGSALDNSMAGSVGQFEFRLPTLCRPS